MTKLSTDWPNTDGDLHIHSFMPMLIYYATIINVISVLIACSQALLESTTDPSIHDKSVLIATEHVAIVYLHQWALHNQSIDRYVHVHVEYTHGR